MVVSCDGQGELGTTRQRQLTTRQASSGNNGLRAKLGVVFLVFAQMSQASSVRPPLRSTMIIRGGIYKKQLSRLFTMAVF
jgi:hypothetical protein